MDWVLRRLRDTRGPIWRYVLRAYAIQFLPVVTLALLAALATGGAVIGDSGRDRGGIVALLEFVVLAPLFENLLLAAALWIADRVLKTDVARAVAVAIPFGLLHVLGGPLGILAGWSFFVLGMVYLAWRPRSFGHAYGVSVLVHALANVIPGVAAAA